MVLYSINKAIFKFTKAWYAVKARFSVLLQALATSFRTWIPARQAIVDLGTLKLTDYQSQNSSISHFAENHTMCDRSMLPMGMVNLITHHKVQAQHN